MNEKNGAQPRSGDQAARNLYLVGAGVSFPIHLTVQTIDILTACSRICTNLPDSRLAFLPVDLLSKCDCLWPMYLDERDRSDNYRDVADKVLETVEQMRSVAWMTPGHPYIFDSVSQTLLT